VMAILAAAVLCIGVYPKPLTDMMQPSIAQLVAHIQTGKPNVVSVDPEPVTLSPNASAEERAR